MEIKVRITDMKEMVSRLEGLGAKFDREIATRDTYFRQPKGEVLKLSESSEGDFLVHLKAKGGGFEYLLNEKLDDADRTKEELGKKFGVKSVLEKRRRLYNLGNYVLDINMIKNVGNFLVVTGEKVTQDTITKELGLENPEFITVPFDELPKIS